MENNEELKWVRVNITCDRCGNKWPLVSTWFPQENIDASIATCVCQKCKKKVLICPRNATLSHKD